MTQIAVFGIEEPERTTLEALAAQNETIAGIAEMIHSRVSRGELFNVGDDAAPLVHIISLKHRDAPHAAAEVLHIDDMSALLRLFCELHDLPFKSADELLADLSGDELVSSDIINWLSAYVDAYLDHDGKAA